MALHSYRGSGLPPTGDQPPEDMRRHQAPERPDPDAPAPPAPRLRRPPPPSPEARRKQIEALGIDPLGETAPPLQAPTAAGAVAAALVPHVAVTVGGPAVPIPPVSHGQSVVEWPFTGSVFLELTAEGGLQRATVQLSGERGTVVKDGATIAEAAMAALAEFEEAMAQETAAETLARMYADAQAAGTDPLEFARQVMATLGGTQ